MDSTYVAFIHRYTKIIADNAFGRVHSLEEPVKSLYIWPVRKMLHIEASKVKLSDAIVPFGTIAGKQNSFIRMSKEVGEQERRRERRINGKIRQSPACDYSFADLHCRFVRLF